VLDVDDHEFEDILEHYKDGKGYTLDTDLSAKDWRAVIGDYKAKVVEATGKPFPQEPKDQLWGAIAAVFGSWMGQRAITYRRLNNIPGDWGTAVNVQAMVFGNMGDDSGTGVLFSRDPSTGVGPMMGEFLQNAQGEDVVAGIRTPVNVDKMADVGPAWKETYLELLALCDKLEAAYKDMVDIEFTVQQGQLFVLQSRTGKRSARAAFKIAVDLVLEHEIDVETALSRLTVDQFKTMRRPTIDPKFKVKPDVVGLPACPGVVTGKPVFSSNDAVSCSEPCILVTHETDPDDIAGMAKALGILTQTGGATSHAAVVARAMDKACVVGATELDIPSMKTACYSKVTIDGATGRVWFDKEVPVIDSSADPAARQVMDWCLAKLDAVEASPVGLGDSVQHRVFATHWWGNAEVADAVLADMSQKAATIDLRSPRQLAQSVDLDLLDCFGVTESNDFAKTAKALVKAQPHLKGLVEVATDNGLTHKMAVPAEYAAYRVLSH